MSQKIILFLSFFLFLFSYHFAFANVEINEIMYDLKTGSDDGREWVEVFNDSDSPVDFSIFKFFEGDTNHKLTLIQGDIKVGTAGYAIIVADNIKFKIDWPNFSGNIFDSSFSLSNSGETLAIKNADLILDEYTYKSSSGGAGDGKSLQKIDGVWVASIPTPGTENRIVYTPPPIAQISKSQSKVSKVTIEELGPKTEETVPQKEKITNTSLIQEYKEEKQGVFCFLFFVTSSIILTGVGEWVVYLVRRKKNVPMSGDDFEI